MTAFARAALLWAALLLAGWHAPLQAQEPQPVPPLSGRIIDRTATLDAAQRDRLQARLERLEAERGSQLVVLIVASTLPEDIAAYAQRVADSWKIGRRDVGDGVLIVVAKDDRRMRIEVAKALEGALPDLAAKQIIDGTLRPAFRDGDYAGGLERAIERIDQRLSGEGLPAPAPRDAGGGGALPFEDLGMFLFAAVPVAAFVITRIFGRKLGSLLVAGGAGGVAWLFSSSLLLAIAAGVLTLLAVGVMGLGSAVRRGVRHVGPPWVGGWGGGGWSGGGGSGGFGGGGFSSGGGGDFGGGGASGDW